MSSANPNTDAYAALCCSLVDLVVVRIGGYGTIEHNTVDGMVQGELPNALGLPAEEG